MVILSLFTIVLTHIRKNYRHFVCRIGNGREMRCNKRLIKLLYIMLFVAVFTLNGCSTLSDETRQAKDMANENYDKGHSLLEEGKLEEAITYYLLALDNIESLPEDNTDDKKYSNLQNNIYNDLSEAYYQLEQFETSLEHIELALNIKPNRYFEYINYGNALFSLDRNEEAEANYKEALSLKDNAVYAIYGLGSVYFENGKYEDALEQFERYMEYENNDIDGIMYMVDCYTQMGNNEKGLEFIDEMLKSNSDKLELLIAKGEFLNLTKSYEEVEVYYKNLQTTYPDNIQIEMLLGKLYYNNAMYDEAVDYFMELSKKYPEDGEISSWIVYCYEEQNEFEHISEYVQSAVENGFDSEELYNTVGNAYLNKYMYMEAVPYFEEAIQLNKEEVDPYLNILYGLYNGKRYSKCIEFGLIAAEQFPDDYDIPWYLGDCYYNLSDYTNAILQYKNALALDVDNEEILAQIAETYLMLEDYNNAKEYADKTLAINSENTDGLYVKETISDKQKPIGEQLSTFIKDSYLYSNDEQNLKLVLESLFKKENISNAEIAEAVEEMRIPEDLFTFVIPDDNYDYMMEEMADEVEYSVNGNQVYLRLSGFYVNTDNNIIEILDEVEDTENKTLIIDLRSNAGGLTDSANNILDLLLPECVTSTLISREGYTYNYYSDDSHIKFKKIYIFVDEYTASASELLTLGLKTYLNNVTIVGRNTYGKGVGQTVFEDKERKLLVYLVNHYWNVREQNIMSTGITPDVYMESNALEDYMKIIDDAND